MPTLRLRRPAAAAALAAAIALTAGRGPAADPKATPADVKAMVDKAAAFLKSRQGEDGAIAPKLGGPGITALSVAALVRHGYPADHPVVASGLKHLETQVKPDGGVYSKGLANYTTALAVVAFKEANRGGKYDAVIANAGKFLRSLQYGEGTDSKDLKFGGTGYDGKSRPDVSNTQFFVEALVAAGATKDDPAIQRAVTFVSRSQNLPGETNDQPFAKKTTDDDRGGLVYNPLDQDNDKSPKRTAAGGLRSEGGMTYAGLKSFLYAGVSKDDPRVKGAVGWIKRHYTLDQNPGMGTAGLFYYYHTFAKAMDALGENPFTDAKGVPHDWKAELTSVLKKQQKPDGSWANENKAFLENAPELATAFALLALSYAK